MSNKTCVSFLWSIVVSWLLIGIWYANTLTFEIPATPDQQQPDRMMSSLFLAAPNEQEPRMIWNHDGNGANYIEPWAFRDRTIVVDDMAFDVQSPLNMTCPQGFVVGTNQAWDISCAAVSPTHLYKTFLTVYQARVVDVCPDGQFVTAIHNDGTISCAAPDIEESGEKVCRPNVIVEWSNGHPGWNAPTVISRPRYECEENFAPGWVFGQLNLQEYSCPAWSVISWWDSETNEPQCVTLASDISCPAWQSLRGISMEGAPICEATCAWDELMCEGSSGDVCPDALAWELFLWNDGYQTASQWRYDREICSQPSAIGMYINTVSSTAWWVKISFHIPKSDYTFEYTTPIGWIDARDLRDVLYDLLIDIPEVTDHYVVWKSLITISHTHNGREHNHYWVRLQSREDDLTGEYEFSLLNGVWTSPKSMVQFQTHNQWVLQN